MGQWVVSILVFIGPKTKNKNKKNTNRSKPVNRDQTAYNRNQTGSDRFGFFPLEAGLEPNRLTAPTGS
jgi:hypothetical protein